MAGMSLELWVAGVGLAALVAYALLGGADFGGGVWDLLASGPRATEQRRAISRAMGPVWEANHVWLIFLVVLLFACFPRAYAVLSVALFIPFHLALVGIVLRGSAFVFRAHGATAEAPDPRWTRVFGAASSATPFVLGMCLGAVSSGRLRALDGRVVSDAWSPWLGPFAWALGALSLALCAYVAAVYLTLETEGAVQEDFRRRALGAGLVLAVLAPLALAAARVDAPRFWEAMTHPRAAPVLLGAAALAALSARAVYGRWYRWGRVAAAAQTTLIVLGWALAQHPYVVYPDLPLAAAAAPAASLRFFLWTLIPGGLVLLPSLALLFLVFKGVNPAGPAERTEAADAPAGV
ncbi:MAG TPA: cytochrome d ubiquinol oxidase subunit II [Armatimonadota bacterium]|nr:cytochrome d ubiquinol oxidase subunit II [Armatimonadota bacterium]